MAQNLWCGELRTVKIAMMVLGIVDGIKKKGNERALAMKKSS
jgi:hypothetical protein